MMYVYLYLLFHTYFTIKLAIFMKNEWGTLANQLKQDFTIDSSIGQFLSHICYSLPLILKYYSIPYYFYFKWAHHFWKQDLRGNDNDKKYYKYFKRGSLYPNCDGGYNLWKFHWEIAINNPLRFKLGLGMEINRTENEIIFRIQPLLMSIYLTFKHKLIKFEGYNNTDWSVSVEDYTLRWNFGTNRDGWSNKTPKWKYHNIDFRDVVLGHTKLITNEIGWLTTTNTLVEFRNKIYTIDEIKVEKNERFRKNIPFSIWNKQSYSYGVKVSKPPMFAGKGENSYDCDDDAIYGLFGPLPDKVLAPDFNRRPTSSRLEVRDWVINKYFESVSRDIKKYGKADGDKSNSYDFKILDKKPENNLSEKLMAGHGCSDSNYIQ